MRVGAGRVAGDYRRGVVARRVEDAHFSVALQPPSDVGAVATLGEPNVENGEVGFMRFAKHHAFIHAMYGVRDGSSSSFAVRRAAPRLWRTPMAAYRPPDSHL